VCVVYVNLIKSFLELVECCCDLAIVKCAEKIGSYSESEMIVTLVIARITTKSVFVT